ncbi:MAG: hypothetical protein CVU98_09375 [Firmicutes bacterium HGW-Firmicutes-3]|jgi:hypothetical protein|nr:MAG: hypothetical protein CVU98_09375 [Firmicutes bacterium HGW-Firmicutes-3]
MTLESLRKDCSIRQKKGLHFILASIIIWLLVTVIHTSDYPILTKNLLTFCATAPLLPIAFAFSKVLKIEFSDKKNPLNQLGLLFSMNQLLYLLIAMWIYPTVPEKMVMVIAMIFGAHLLPYSWLYQSKSYLIMSILIPISALIVGNIFEVYVLGLLMILYQILFSIVLGLEVKALIRTEGRD